MAENKIIAITGSPGTGKSEIAKILVREIRANAIAISELVRKGYVTRIFDAKRHTWIVGEKAVRKAVRKRLVPGDNVIEGLLAHEVPADFIFVLRCRPDVLRKRLANRGWPKRKIEENVEAEMVDVILAEALEAAAKKKSKIYEIDSTKRKPAETARIIAKILKSAAYGKRYRPGRISWLD